MSNAIIPTTKAEQNKVKAIIGTSYNKLYSQFQSDELCDVGNYKILNQIGEGSFGKVYLALHRLTHHKVVLKTSDKNDPNIVREVFYHRQFNYPHITKLYEVIVTENKVWMALEYCPGKELYDHLLQMKRIPISQCIELFSQICGAVYYAHTLNCVHRDLKLENILLDKDDQAKLTDFGFTRECTTKSILETVCGTTVYMAPELTERKVYDGFKIDIWALGVILYTMMTGSMPFDEDDEARIKWKIVNEMPNFDSDVIGHDAKDLLVKLLSKDPSKRPTMREILEHDFLHPYGSVILEEADDILRKQRDGNARFHSKQERRLLKILRRAGFDIHAIKNSVIKRKCDTLSCLWFLLLEQQTNNEKHRRPRRNRSVLSVRKVFDGSKSMSDVAADDGIIRTSLELTKVASISKIISKTADVVSLSPLIRQHSNRTTKGESPSILLDNNKSNRDTLRVTSLPVLRGASARKNNSIFKKFSEFFKQKKYLNNSNELTDEFRGTENHSIDGGHRSRKSININGYMKRNSDKSDSDSKDNKRLGVNQKNKSPVKLLTSKIRYTEGDQRNKIDEDSKIGGRVKYKEPDMKRFKSTASSENSRHPSLGNYDSESLSVFRVASSDLKASPKLFQTRPLSNISQFSNDTNTSDYSTDGNATFYDSFDSSARPSIKHSNSQYSTNSNSELIVKPTSSRRYLRRNLSVRSETSTTSERSSRTDSFYDITTATTQTKPNARNKKTTNIRASVLPHFGMQQGSSWSSSSKNGYISTRRSSFGRRRRAQKPSFLNNSHSGTDNVIREESSSADNESDIHQEIVTKVHSDIQEEEAHVMEKEGNVHSDSESVMPSKANILGNGYTPRRISDTEFNKREISEGSRWSEFQSDSKSFVTGTEDDASVSNADGEDNEDDNEDDFDSPNIK